MSEIIVYDNKGESFDQYTIGIQDLTVGEDEIIFHCYGASAYPYHPQGFGMYVGENLVGEEECEHLGERVETFEELPEQVRKFIEIIAVECGHEKESISLFW